MVIFQDAPGQLTPQSVIQAGRNSNSPEICFICYCYLQGRRISDQKYIGYSVEKILPIISLWQLSFTMISVPIAFKPNHAIMLLIKFDCDWFARR